VSTDRQRDADLDRLLRAQLRREPAGAPDACPDAGMLAACVEGGVAGEERTALEAHLAVCGRCQDVLAAMDLETPASPAAAQAPVAAARQPWLWRGHLHWLLPVGAAAALVVYVASKPAIAPYFPHTGPGQDTQMSELRPAAQPPDVSGFASRPDERPAPASQATPAPVPAAPARAADEPSGPPAAPSIAARDRARNAAPASVPEAPPTPSKGERGTAPTNTAERTALDVDASKRAAQRVAETPAPGAQAARVAPAPAPPATVAQSAGVAAPLAPAAPVPQTAVAVVAGAAHPAGTGAAQGIAATQTAAKGTAADAAAPVQLKDTSVDRAVRTAASDVIEVSAPGGQIQWRVGPEGGIWRSADEGRSWYPQKSGVKTALLAVTAPSISTCWAVGAGGTVLLTDDGERWERRPFPEKIDLVVVDARSAHEATVTTRDGRRFTTTDRGGSWTLQR
jgi:hypothetical protein